MIDTAENKHISEIIFQLYAVTSLTLDKLSWLDLFEQMGSFPEYLLWLETLKSAGSHQEELLRA